MCLNSSFTDDIPIQAGDESGIGNVSQLISITEESEPPTGSGGTTTETSQLGMRNNLVRSSKEILKTHKVPFPGFKKKDKDKEKEKEKEKDKSVSRSPKQAAVLLTSPSPFLFTLNANRFNIFIFFHDTCSSKMEVAVLRWPALVVVRVAEVVVVLLVVVQRCHH